MVMGTHHGNGVLAPPPLLWDGVGWCVVGVVCGYDRIFSTEFGHVAVFRSNFHVRTSCITLYLSTSHRLHNQKETRAAIPWAGGAGNLPGFLTGPKSDHLNATSEMWAFFESHPKPE